MTKIVDAEAQYYSTLRVALIGFAKGVAPVIAVEFARRAIPHACRPSFKEFEIAYKGGPAAEAKAA
jgi:chemotaxis protein MotA